MTAYSFSDGSNPYKISKPLFATVTWWGVDLSGIYTCICIYNLIEYIYVVQAPSTMSKTSVGCYFIVACLPNSYVFSNENITSWRKTDYRMWISSDFSRFFESQVLDKQFEEPPESRGISFQRQQFSLQFTPWCCKHELMFNGLIFFVCPSLCVLIVVCLRRPKHGIVRLNLNQKQTELFERKVPKECIFWVHKHSWPTRPTKRAKRMLKETSGSPLLVYVGKCLTFVLESRSKIQWYWLYTCFLRKQHLFASTNQSVVFEELGIVEQCQYFK